MKKLFKLLAVCMLVSIIGPVIIPFPIIVAEAAEVKLNKTSVSVQVNQTYQLKISGTTKKVTWSSSNKKVATVSSNGKIKGIKTGTATITAKVSGKNYTTKVTVIEKISYEDFGYEEYVYDIDDYSRIYTEFIKEKKAEEGYFQSYESSDGNSVGIVRTARNIRIGSKS